MARKCQYKNYEDKNKDKNAIPWALTKEIMKRNLVKEIREFNRGPSMTKNDWPSTAEEQIFQEGFNLLWKFPWLNRECSLFGTAISCLLNNCE